MALRLASKRLLSKQLQNAAARSFLSTAPATTTAPSVFDKIINITIVDPSGARRKIPGLIGEIDIIWICQKSDMLLARRWKHMVPHCFALHNCYYCSPHFGWKWFFVQAQRSMRHAKATKSNLDP